MTLEYPEPQVIVQQVQLCLPLYTFDLSQDLDVEQTIDKIKDLRQQYPRTTTTNVKTQQGWRSPYFTVGSNDSQAVNRFDQEIELIQSKLKTINSFDVRLVNLWTVIYNNMDWVKEHNHYSLWDSMAYNTVLYLTDSLTPIDFGTMTILPKRAMLLVMHPLTMHSVGKVEDTTDRIILAANFAR